MIISFKWTVGALLSGQKTVTRRFWKDNYALRFKLDSIHDAYSRSPRVRGIKVATIKITRQPYKQKLKDMSQKHFEREGGKRYWKDLAEFVEAMGGPEAEPWVVEFELVNRVPEMGLFD